MKQLFFLLSTLLLISETYSQNAEEYLWGGMTKLLELKDYRGAIADFNKAIELSPKYGAAYYYRGYSKATLEDHRGAIADFTKVIELDPKDETAYLRRGLTKLLLEQKESGCMDFSKAGELGSEKAYELIRDFCK